MSTIETILDAIIDGAKNNRRYMVAIAGPPGAGKSTLSRELLRRLPVDSAKVVEMDGFHYDNTVLDQLGLRNRKGAPETFDYPGLVVLLDRIRRIEPNIAVPLFDREADLARAAADIIDVQVKFILIEGNYLLLNEEPWSGLRHYFDARLFLDVNRKELERRLLQRWFDLGYTDERAHHWVASNDMPNVDRVLRGLDQHSGATLVQPVAPEILDLH